MLALAERACCCPARPVVKVLIPPIPGRPHAVDLLLCGHHYRLSRGALEAIGAVALDETGSLIQIVTSEHEVASPEPAERTPRRLPG